MTDRRDCHYPCHCGPWFHIVPCCQQAGFLGLFPSRSRLAGPVKYSIPDAVTVILTCNRSLKWPALMGVAGIGFLVGSVWAHRLWPSFFTSGCLR
jgi:hypothetical protein